MDKDDIIKLAREAGITMSVKLNPKFETESTLTKEQFCFAALAREHAMHELARLGQEIEQEPTQWRDMVVVSLVREGIDKHRARELADHFAEQRPWQGLTDEDLAQIDTDEFWQVGNHMAIAMAVEDKLKERNT